MPQKHERMGNAFNTFMGRYVKMISRWIGIYPVAEHLTASEHNVLLLVVVGSGLRQTAIFHDVHPNLSGELWGQDETSVAQAATAVRSL